MTRASGNNIPGTFWFPALSTLRITFLTAGFCCALLNTCAQCCTNGVNLLAAYNCNFSDTFSTIPPGFTNSNIFATHPVGSGYYYIVASRGYGACSHSPQYDHTSGDSSGRYVWFDTPSWATELNPAVAWVPFNASLPAGEQNLIPVLPDTTYVFSIWVRDLARADDCVSGGAPVAGIRINGVDMGEINLGDFTSPCCPDWTLLCTLWHSGTDTTALLKIESRYGGGFTDLGIDDVYFGLNTNSSTGPNTDTSLCLGQPLLLKDTATNASFLWSNGTSDSVLSVSLAGTYWVQVRQNDCVTTDTILVALKSPDVISLGNDTSVCSGASVVLNATAPGATYLWQDGSTASQYTVTSTGKYSVTVADSGCVSADSIFVTVTSLPPIIINSDTNVICRGDSVMICAPSGYSMYLWTTGQTTTCMEAISNGRYSVTVTDSSGCTAPSNNLSVTVLPSPSVTISNNGPDSLCSTDSTQICALAGFQSYMWNTGQTTSCITTRDAGNYYVTVTDANGCSAQSNHVDITVIPIPPVTISITGDTLIAYNASSYQWFLNGDTIAGATQFTYIATSPGNYMVVISGAGGCLAFSNPVIISGIAPDEATGNVMIFPNPTNGAWHLLTSANFAGGYAMLYSTDGRLVYKSVISASSFTIGEGQELPADGIYLLRLTGKTGECLWQGLLEKL